MGAKVLAVASGGGHWVQMRRLGAAFEGLDVAYVSVKADYAQDVPGRRFYAIRDASRFQKFNFLIVIGELARILLKERPRVVVTTGSAPGLVALALAKSLLGARTMWIDSIANCERMSSSGLRARWVADVWLTQWPQLAAGGGPEPKSPAYWGAVL